MEGDEADCSRLSRSTLAPPGSRTATGLESGIIESGKDSGLVVVEHRGFEPLTYCLQSNRATNCANAPIDLDILCQNDADAKWGWWSTGRVTIQRAVSCDGSACQVEQTVGRDHLDLETSLA